MSKVEYWIAEKNGDVNLFSISNEIPPIVGEIIHIDTHIEEEEYRFKFDEFDKSLRFYDKGVRGEYKVISVKRYITGDYKLSDEPTMPQLPIRKDKEMFEVFVEEFDVLKQKK